MMLVSKKFLKNKIKKKIAGAAFLIIKPFIVPIIILLIFILIISTITDILYIGFDNEDEIDMEKELAYYDTEYNEENDKNEVVEFFKSVWDFVAGLFSGLFSGGMAEDTDWPVERTLYYYKLFWEKRSSNSRCINFSYRNRYCCSRRCKTC